MVNRDKKDKARCRGMKKEIEIVHYEELSVGQKFKFYGRTGELLTKPKQNGVGVGYYSDIRYEDGMIIKDFMICRRDLEWKLKNMKVM